MSGSDDFTFTLFDTNSGGSPVAGPITNTAVAVNGNGLFTTTMDFGSSLYLLNRRESDIGWRLPWHQWRRQIHHAVAAPANNVSSAIHLFNYRRHGQRGFGLRRHPRSKS